MMQTQQHQQNLQQLQHQRSLNYARTHNLHSGKRQLLGNQAGHAAPAWRPNAPVAPAHSSLIKGKASAETGSRIFLSKLPSDVGEREVEELFNKTVGPLKESFLVYNSQGKSKGMAVVTFQRPGDALVARAKYNGRVVDGRRPIKIEILVDTDAPVTRAPQAPAPTPSLFDRLALPAPQSSVATLISPAAISKPIPTAPRQPPRQPKPQPVPQVAPQASPAPVNQVPIPPRKIKQKKGPKRLKKKEPVTVADLDQEMEDYRASAPDYLGL